MKAAKILEPYRVDICDIAEPRVKREDVLIRVQKLGLCGSDLTTYRGLNPMVTYPRIPGHEIAGEIVEKGSAVPSKFQPGLMVAVLPYTTCGKCSSCKIGRVNCCQFNQTMGVQRDGAATEYIAVPYHKVFIVEGLTDEQIACIEPLSVGWHASNRACITTEDIILVFGCGVIGLGAIAACSFRKSTVIAVDIDNGKLEKAKQFGAKYTLNARCKNFEEELKHITSGDGPSVVIEAVGSPRTFTKAVDIVSFAGRVVYIGYTKEKVKYNTKLFISKELDIKGSRNALDEELLAVIDMLSAGKVDVCSLITQRFSIDQLDKALSFWDASPAKVTKIMISF
jgi:2-desacetyl-2-hydroxyethyl bacteriochlorophyllide A dehydrogenase